MRRAQIKLCFTYAMLHCAVLRYTVRCYAVLRYDVLCCVLLSYDMRALACWTDLQCPIFSGHCAFVSSKCVADAFWIGLPEEHEVSHVSVMLQEQPKTLSLFIRKIPKSLIEVK